MIFLRTRMLLDCENLSLPVVLDKRSVEILYVLTDRRGREVFGVKETVQDVEVQDGWVYGGGYLVGRGTTGSSFYVSAGFYLRFEVLGLETGPLTRNVKVCCGVGRAVSFCYSVLLQHFLCNSLEISWIAKFTQDIFSLDHLDSVDPFKRLLSKHHSEISLGVCVCKGIANEIRSYSHLEIISVHWELVFFVVC